VYVCQCVVLRVLPGHRTDGIGLFLFLLGACLTSFRCFFHLSLDEKTAGRFVCVCVLFDPTPLGSELKASCTYPSCPWQAQAKRPLKQ
jgi:hypothetical protein